MGQGELAAALAAGSALAMAISNVLVRVAELAAARRGAAALAAGTGLSLRAVLWWTTAINAALLGAAWLVLRGRGAASPLPIDAGTWALVVAGGLLGQWLGRVALYDGLRRHGPGWIAAGKATAPLIAAVLALLLLGERPRPAVWVGLALVTAGTALPAAAGGAARPRAAAGLRAGLWAALWLGASLVARRAALQAWPDTVGMALAGSLVAWVALAGGRWAVPTLPAAARPAVLASGVASALALLLQLAALRLGEVAVVAGISHAEPVIALAIAHWLLGGSDRVPWTAAAGAALVVAGVIGLG